MNQFRGFGSFGLSVFRPKRRRAYSAATRISKRNSRNKSQESPVRTGDAVDCARVTVTGASSGVLVSIFGGGARAFRGGGEAAPNPSDWSADAGYARAGVAVWGGIA